MGLGIWQSRFRLWYLPGMVLSLVLLASCNGRQEEPEAASVRSDTLACDPDNGGISLPPGFCALVVADDLGNARHLAVRDNGDIYVSLRRGGSLAALRDTTGDGRADVIQRFGDRGGTGLKLHDGYLYFAPDDVIRYRLEPGQLVPPGPPEAIVTDFPSQRSHEAKALALDDSGRLFVSVGAPSNNCQARERTERSPGIAPCPELERQAGIWRFAAGRPGQKQVEDGLHFASGIRHAVAMAWNPLAGRLYVVQHGRDQLRELWPDLYTVEENAELPAEEFLLVEEGVTYGWPYSYWDHLRDERMLAPEYGGDGETPYPGRYPDPIQAFPGHWAPNDLLFYTGDQFPEHYRGGAFVAFHGSWNRAPLPQAGYVVAFVPFAGERPAGDYEIFADGFTGQETLESPDAARFRPMGLAQGPDGSLYIADSQKGRVWRVMYRPPPGSTTPP